MRAILIAGDAVYDGERVRADLTAVRVAGKAIEAVGTPERIGGGAPELIALPGMTLLPGLIDLHTHLLLHPFADITALERVRFVMHNGTVAVRADH